MKKQIVIAIAVFLVIVINMFAYAEQKTEDKAAFDISTATQQFDHLQQSLEKQRDYTQIMRSVNQLEDIKNAAKECVSQSESHLKILQDLRATSVKITTSSQGADVKYLSAKEAHYTRQLSECRLLLYRSKEVLNSYKDIMQSLSANQILQRSTPIWRLSDHDGWHSLENFESSKLLAQSGINRITTNERYSLVILVLLTGVIAFYARVILKQSIRNIVHTHTLWQGFLASLAHFIVPLAIFGVLSLFFDAVYEGITPIPSLELINQVILIFLVAASVTRYLFYPSHFCRGIFGLEPQDGRRFYHRILFLLWILLLGVLVAIVFRDQPLAPILVELSRTIYFTFISAIAIWVFFLWFRSSYSSKFRHGSLVVISTLFILALITLVVFEWLGYHHLTVFAVIALCSTAAYSILLVAAWRLIDAIYQLIDNTRYASARNIHQWFDVKMNKQLHEVVLLRIAAHFALLCIYFVFLLKSWSISPVFVDSVSVSLIEGIKFFGLTIVPLRIVLACVVFSVLFMAGRLIAASLANKTRFHGEENTQIAISTISLYVAFAVAFLLALLVTGVDFTGLAIIAGALSVGVGLGLQTIVNNFVSGLILLLEKPIKPGDRILIGKTEGFVRKVRIRSTQIATLSKEDVIIPNADFMTQQVVNYMFRDRYSRVKCRVGVAYGSDTQLVRKVLLDIAEKHPDVVHEAPNMPIVLFAEFGESNLVFELWCVIFDVNKKYVIVSELNFAIDAAFREHKITIPFPQRDVWIKENHRP